MKININRPKMDTVRWTCTRFEDLTPALLYEILKLRSEVFVVEQHCVFLDMDDKDQGAWHLAGWYEDRLVAYTRLLPPGLTYAEASIGRVVSSPSVRRMGFGKELMEVSIQQLWTLFGKQNIRIGAQLYLEQFYGSFGFVSQGEVYIEDDIPHMKMLLSI